MGFAGLMDGLWFSRCLIQIKLLTIRATLPGVLSHQSMRQHGHNPCQQYKSLDFNSGVAKLLPQEAKTFTLMETDFPFWGHSLHDIRELLVSPWLPSFRVARVMVEAPVASFAAPYRARAQFPKVFGAVSIDCDRATVIGPL